MTATTFDPAAVQAALEEMAVVKDADELDEVEELFVTGNFAGWYGSLGELYGEPDLSRIQFQGADGNALELLGHWSVERNDPAEHRPPSYLDEHLNDCGICGYLEGIAKLRQELLARPCTICGRGPEAHDFRPRREWGDEGEELLFWNDPIAWCREPWTRVPDAVVYEEGAFGHFQLSKAYRVAFVAALADGMFAVVRRTYFVAVEDDRRTLEREDIYMVCTDPDNPDGSQVQLELGTEELDADDLPLNDLSKMDEALAELAAESFAPEPGEYRTEMPHAPTFIWE